MINRALLNLYAVFVLLAPVNVLAHFMDETAAAETHTEFEKLKEEKGVVEQLVEKLWSLYSNEENEEEQTVTTAEASRAVAETGEAPEEESQVLENWLNELPAYDDDSPQTQFIQTIAPAAVLIAQRHDIYPSVMIAQASLESSWGQSGLAQDYNNLMGTKGSWNGESITVRSREDVNGESVYINAGFSVYDSWIDSLNRYGMLMANGLEWDPDYYSGVWRRNTSSYKEATEWLQGRYATDSAYAAKLNATIESFQLDRFDEVEPLELELEEVIDEISI